MPIVQDVVDHLEALAPPHYQESYDNSGLLVGEPQREVTGVLVSLDSTEAIIAEAVERGCNMVVAHHPIVFRGLKRLTGRTYVERTVMAALRAGVAIYAIHTNLDNVRRGVNDRIGRQLGLRDMRILAPNKQHSDPDVGSGMLGTLPEAMPEQVFLEYLKARMGADCVRYVPHAQGDIHKVAVCGGAGGFLLESAIAQGADAFVTADYKYHEFFDADGRILLCDVGHYESEQYTIDLLHEYLTEKMPTFAVLTTNLTTNPVRYL